MDGTGVVDGPADPYDIATRLQFNQKLIRIADDMIGGKAPPVEHDIAAPSITALDIHDDSIGLSEFGDVKLYILRLGLDIDC